MDEQRTKTRKTLLSLLIAVAILAVVVFLLFLGPAFVSTTMPNDSYMIEITGLSGLAVNGTATVMIPVPANAEGELVIFEVSGVRQTAGWQAAIRETPYGKMLAFTTTEGYVPDISVASGEFEKKEEPRLLVPVLATTTTRASKSSAGDRAGPTPRSSFSMASSRRRTPHRSRSTSGTRAAGA